MSLFATFVKRPWRMVRSLRHAVFTKAIASTVGRKPSSTCQVTKLDQIIATHLGSDKKGQFVEVGAYDGERFSNTSWLADNGWRGLYLEPSPEFSRLCKLRHCLNKAKVLNLAAGEEESHATLMQIGSLSTMSTDALEEYEHLPWARRVMQKECKPQQTLVRRLDNILSEQGIHPGFELLVVDVEGYEEKVFRGLDLARWRPQMLIVELRDAPSDFDDKSELVESARRVRKLILGAGYSVVYQDDINTIFERHALRCAA
jgi:FkbM family methyltransferase